MTNDFNALIKVLADKSLNPFASLGTPVGAAPVGGPLADYVADYWQRTFLFLDILRRRGDKQEEMTSKPINSVLLFDYEIVLSGESLPRPVNYALTRIVPPKGAVLDLTKRPVVVIDPRAGQGPGIGGFKVVSEIGNAFKAGHPVYFIGFSANPIDGQTIEDIAHAHTVFLQRVIDLHPQADGKPLLFGNCQAGWHTLMAACIRPDLVGPLILAGAPVSYWGGVRGKNPMRYSGGLLGGSWLARLTSDLGGGIFDGAWLISNFDSLNPANTLWSKQYKVWAEPEKQEDNYLRFEEWWGAFIKLRGDELLYMVDNLFIGNKLSTAQIVTRDGTRLDIRIIKSPIICFCSHGDNITPPQQALDWILDNYDSVDEIRAHGQTILYCLNQNAGHLAIFVGTKIAAKEHAEFINYVNMIDTLPPGLYEIVITDKADGDVNADLLIGNFNLRIESRSIQDIRALGYNSIEDEREFEAVTRLSDHFNSLYATFLQPFVKATVTPQVAAAVLASQPLRIQYALFSDKNPLMRQVAALAEQARANRVALGADNPFLQMQAQFSDAIVQQLKQFGDASDQFKEAAFHAVFGSPLVQAALGVKPGNSRPRPKPGVTPDQRAELKERIETLRASMMQGGALEAGVRALIYVSRGAIDARSFEIFNRMLKAHPEITLAQFKDVVRRQWALLAIDQKAALDALPHLLSGDEAARRRVLDRVKAITSAAGELDGENQRRMSEIEALFGVASASPSIDRQPCKVIAVGTGEAAE